MSHLLAFALAAALAAGQETATAAPVWPHLAELEGFLGDWEGTATVPEGSATSEQLGDTQGKKVTLQLSVRWAPGKCAQIIEATYRMHGVVTIRGAGIRAWDQELGKIAEQSYTTHKGTWSGTWMKDGTSWVYEYKGTNLDGVKWAGKRVYAFQDKDHLTMTDTNQTADGQPQPDMVFQFERKR